MLAKDDLCPDKMNTITQLIFHCMCVLRVCVYVLTNVSLNGYVCVCVCVCVVPNFSLCVFVYLFVLTNFSLHVC